MHAMVLSNTRVERLARGISSIRRTRGARDTWGISVIERIRGISEIGFGTNISSTRDIRGIMDIRVVRDIGVRGY
jgi:hypothetical protein